MYTSSEGALVCPALYYDYARTRAVLFLTDYKIMWTNGLMDSTTLGRTYVSVSRVMYLLISPATLDNARRKRGSTFGYKLQQQQHRSTVTWPSSGSHHITAVLYTVLSCVSGDVAWCSTPPKYIDSRRSIARVGDGADTSLANQTLSWKVTRCFYRLIRVQLKHSYKLYIQITFTCKRR